MKYIDIHAHLNFPDFAKDQEEAIIRAKDAGVAVINVGTGAETSKEVVALAQKHDHLYAIIGIHPKHSEDEDFNVIQNLVIQPKVVGIGECGLDYFVRNGEAEITAIEKERQETLFRKHIDLALEYDKPLMLHIRNAYTDALTILGEYKKVAGEKLRGNAHFFAGTLIETQGFLDLGFTLSFTGVITFAKDYEKLVQMVPLDRIFSETDTPYVAPVPYRGARNEPVYVIEVVKKIAEIKGLEEEVVREAIQANTKRLFGI